MTSPAPPTVQLSVAELVQALSARRVDDQDRAAARLRLADTAFATLVGGRTGQGRRSAELAAGLHQAGSLAGTAFRLVGACRMTEIDDIDLPSCITPGAVVVPTVLAALAADVGSGLDVPGVLDVVVRGYEVAVGLGEAMRGPYRLAGGTWPTLAVGGVTAAAVTCWLLDAAPEELAAAVVLAAHQSTLANPRGNAREVFLANAVVTGIGSALAARHGFAVPGDLTGGLADLFDTVPAPGPARIHRPAVKSFCSARQAMTAVSALRAILATEDLPVGAIDRIEVEVPAEYAAMLDKPTVSARRESLSSVQYQLALAALEPDGLLDVDRPTLRTNPAVRSLMSTIQVRPAGDLSTRYPAQWPARVRVRAGRRSVERLADHVPGERDLSAERLRAKVADLTRATPALTQAAAELVERSLAAAEPADLRAVAALIDPVLTKEAPA